MNLKMKGIRSVETSVTIYHSTRRKIPEDLHLQSHRCQNSNLPKSRTSLSLSHLRFTIVFKADRHWTLSLSQKNSIHITIPYGRLASVSYFHDECHILPKFNLKPDVRLQYIRKLFWYLSIDLFLVSVKYSLKG
jgi:hypothetical protein